VTTCPRPEDLYLYLEGGLGPYKARALEEHIECCAACREALAERRLLHEAFTSLPPFEVPPDFARSVMDNLPEPEEVRASWLAPLLAATAALVVGLLGFNVLTGTSLSDVLVATNRAFGSVAGTVLPLAAKAFKIAAVLLKVASDAAEMLFSATGAFSRSLGPPGVALALGLGGAVFLLALFGARRLLSLGERS
jgi:predicted anti-sigma-YlaC factor YlaD